MVIHLILSFPGETSLEEKNMFMSSMRTVNCPLASMVTHGYFFYGGQLLSLPLFLLLVLFVYAAVERNGAT